MSKETIGTIRQPGAASVDHTELTDEDLRQLVIHYATLIRKPGPVKISPILEAFQAWPKELQDRFRELVVTEAQSANGRPFWARPADNNNRYGVDN